MEDELLEANGVIKQLVDAVESGNRLRIESALRRAVSYMDGGLTMRGSDGAYCDCDNTKPSEFDGSCELCGLRKSPRRTR